MDNNEHAYKTDRLLMVALVTVVSVGIIAVACVQCVTTIYWPPAAAQTTAAKDSKH